MQEYEIRDINGVVALTFDGMFFIIIIFHCCRLNFRAAATVLSFYGAFTTIKEKKKKKTAHKEIFIVRRSQGHMQVNFIVSFYETAANYFSFFCLFVLACCFCFVYVFVCFICLFFFLRSLNCWFHVTPLKFKLKNYRSFRDFTFTMH